MRRLVSWFFVAVIGGLVALGGTVGAASPAAADSAQRCPNPKGCVRALSITGYIDAITVDFIDRAVTESENTPGYLAVVLILNSPGVVVSDSELEKLMVRLDTAELPVSAWVGPSGAEALGGAAEVVAVLDSSMAPNSEIGDAGEQRLSTQRFGTLFSGSAARARSEVLDDKEATKAGVVLRTDPTLGDHVLEIEDMPFKQVTDSDGRPKRQIAVDGVTEKLPLTSQLFHTAASPGVAYLMLSIAIGLLLFEFFTAGVGVAGVVGAVCAVLASYGLAALPVRGWALGLCLFAAFAFAIDIQTAIPRVWTGIGLVCWLVGSVFLFDGFRAPWLAMASGMVGMTITMVSGMPSMVRSRFATPTLGRDWMIGKLGTATSDINPDGTVTVDEGEWRALTNRATPVLAGEAVRVVSIDGLTLEIEPLDGGAVDYREQRTKRSSRASES